MDVENIYHHILMVLVLDILVVHAEAYLAQVQEFSREFESVQEWLLVWKNEAIAGVFLLLRSRIQRSGDAELIIECFECTRPHIPPRLLL